MAFSISLSGGIKKGKTLMRLNKQLYTVILKNIFYKVYKLITKEFSCYLLL